MDAPRLKSAREGVRQMKNGPAVALPDSTMPRKIGLVLSTRFVMVTSPRMAFPAPPPDWKAVFEAFWL
jgi:hypothetical protein